jgi:hypothetical protein
MRASLYIPLLALTSLGSCKSPNQHTVPVDNIIANARTPSINTPQITELMDIAEFNDSHANYRKLYSEIQQQPTIDDKIATLINYVHPKVSSSQPFALPNSGLTPLVDLFTSDGFTELDIHNYLTAAELLAAFRQDSTYSLVPKPYKQDGYIYRKEGLSAINTYEEAYQRLLKN